MFERLVEQVAEVTGCDPAALSALIGQPTDDALGTAGLVDRVGALERLAQTAQQLQARDLAALHTAQVADDARLKVRPELRGRTVAVEVAKGLGVATMTATSKVDTARAAVDHHPRLLELIGTGRVSMAGLNRVVTATAVLDPHRQERVDALLADEATRRQMTPGQLAKAAERRVLQVDPDAAAARAAYARSTRDVRLTDPWQGMAQICATLTAAEALAIHQHLERYARGQRSAGDPRSLNTLRADLFVQTLLGRSPAPTGQDSEKTADQTGGQNSGQTGAQNSEQFAGRSADQGCGQPDWRSTRGLEPWLISTPPPVREESDPSPEHACWDTFPSCPTSPDPPDPPDPPPGRQWPPGPPVNVELQIVISAATALGLDREPGLLRGYGAIPVDLVEEILDTAQHTEGATCIRRLLCDPVDGRLLQMESTARRFTGTLRQFTTWRDQHDRLLGGTIADIDHITDHHLHGPTTAHNGQALSRRTHRIKDHPAVTVQTLAHTTHTDGLDYLRTHAPDITWTLPTGRRHQTAPPPALGPGSDPPTSPHPPDPDDPDHHPAWLSMLARIEGLPAPSGAAMAKR